MTVQYSTCLFDAASRTLLTKQAKHCSADVVPPHLCWIWCAEFCHLSQHCASDQSRVTYLDSIEFLAAHSKLLLWTRLLLIIVAVDTGRSLGMRAAGGGGVSL